MYHNFNINFVLVVDDSKDRIEIIRSIALKDNVLNERMKNGRLKFICADLSNVYFINKNYLTFFK
jgi:hypothetical protein